MQEITTEIFFKINYDAKKVPKALLSMLPKYILLHNHKIFPQISEGVLIENLIHNYFRDKPDPYDGFSEDISHCFCNPYIVIGVSHNYDYDIHRITVFLMYE
jgi:hypothetical protein